ncbi:MAG: aconitate hydratase, partial [Gemmatimonadetes bacterium]|nr:aconitate hydratase [Gemmatimonadota bacterium]NIR42036.1 aconitate hydratase [Actinomycetota bacterium]NIS37179.1 aconitate hydratase [Actinomycetota bacterium]NIU71625.1 aconitate hydratase [Actinomycetota bacterium]NIW33581.1 aconitate hydratase [Actinomycetota bacterium]
RIHWQNLVNFGVLPLEFTSRADYEHIDPGDELVVDRLPEALDCAHVTVYNRTKNASYRVAHRLSARQVAIV